MAHKISKHRKDGHAAGGYRGILTRIIFATASVAGGICIVAFICATVFDLTLVMFKSGSMSPSMPTGSLAIVQKIPASDVNVGDVVTIDREGQLPLTHRVVSISEPDNATRALTLRGDANVDNDPEPYRVSDVRIVRASFPGLAYPIAALSHPVVLGIMPVIVAALITWTFWPQSKPAGQQI